MDFAVGMCYLICSLNCQAAAKSAIGAAEQDWVQLEMGSGVVRAGDGSSKGRLASVTPLGVDTFAKVEMIGSSLKGQRGWGQGMHDGGRTGRQTPCRDWRACGGQ